MNSFSLRRALVRRLRLPAVTALVVTLGAALLVTSAPDASADIQDLSTVGVQGPYNSSDSKSSTATCPSGTRVLSTGYLNGGASGEVVIDDLVMNYDDVVATSYEVPPGTADSWSLRALARCGDPDGSVTRTWRTSAWNSAVRKTVTITCPAGKVVYGTGAEVTGATGAVAISDIIPSTTQVTVSAVEIDNGTAANWKVRAYGLCAESQANRELVSQTTASNSLNKGATAVCPAGKELTGTGFDIANDNGRVAVEDLWPQDAEAHAYASEVAGNSGNWALTTYAICVTP
jgi:hypothetical protein